MKIYYDNFSSYKDLTDAYSVGESQIHPNGPFPAESEVIYADYTYEDYSGDSTVLFLRDGKIYEFVGGHCSCYGLEDAKGWLNPTPVSVESLRMEGKYKQEGYRLGSVPSAYAAAVEYAAKKLLSLDDELLEMYNSTLN